MAFQVIRQGIERLQGLRQLLQGLAHVRLQRRILLQHLFGRAEGLLRRRQGVAHFRHHLAIELLEQHIGLLDRGVEVIADLRIRYLIELAGDAGDLRLQFIEGVRHGRHFQRIPVRIERHFRRFREEVQRDVQLTGQQVARA